MTSWDIRDISQSKYSILVLRSDGMRSIIVNWGTLQGTSFDLNTVIQARVLKLSDIVRYISLRMLHITFRGK